MEETLRQAQGEREGKSAVRAEPAEAAPAERSVLDDMPKVLGDDGQFHAQDAAVDFSDTTPEAWVALGFFFLLGLTVFYQFITRYALNDSAAWTEEIARYLLIATVFTGAAIGVAKNTHIQVDFFYRHMPLAVGRWLARMVDVLRILFFGTVSVLTVQMMLKLVDTRMTIIDLPMNLVYGICLLGFLAMFARSIWVMRIHMRRGYSMLERPDTTMDDRH